MALWARLGDGDRALAIFKPYLVEQATKSMLAKCGVTPQVDGCLGMTAAITEMLVQSHRGMLELLPALPGEWASGRLNGACVRGGFCLDMLWDQRDGGGIEITVTIARKSGEAGQECWVATDDVESVTVTVLPARLAGAAPPEVLCTTDGPVQVFPPCKVVVLKNPKKSTTS